MVPDELLLSFFTSCKNSLAEINCKEVLRGEIWTTAECRQYLLDKQRAVLSAELSIYNQKSTDNSRTSTEEVKERLMNIKKEVVSPELGSAMSENDAAWD